jgi:hypothetical protein
MYYKKYQVNFDRIKLDEIVGATRFQYSDCFFEYDTLQSVDQLIDLVSPVIKFNIQPDRCSITKMTPPGMIAHCDQWPVSLNFYLTTAGGKTVFYEPKSGVTVTPASSYTDDQIVPVQTFDPEQFDLYLFNTHKIHSVTVPGESQQDRYIFRFVWSNNSFDQIANSINTL